MPKIEPCSRCGKNVLISRYSWTTTKVICSSCSEVETLQKSSEKKVNELEKVEDLEQQPTRDSRIYELNRFVGNVPDKSQEEILVTWTSLLKISAGSILGLLLILGVVLGWRNFDHRFFYDDQTPSEKI